MPDHMHPAMRVGAFMVCAVLIDLAGVLARFASDAFASMQRDFTLVALMFAVYLLERRAWAHCAVP